MTSSTLSPRLQVNDVWLLLGLAGAARGVAHQLPAAPLARLLRLLGDRRVKLPESEAWNEEWDVLYAISSAIELPCKCGPPEPEAWAAILRRISAGNSSVHPCDSVRISIAHRSCALTRWRPLWRGTQTALLDVAPRTFGNSWRKKSSTDVIKRPKIFLEGGWWLTTLDCALGGDRLPATSGRPEECNQRGAKGDLLR
jgi:hypothetical protein